jgi:tetratricopeptide (TPR) repeat protein
VRSTWPALLLLVGLGGGCAHRAVVASASSRPGGASASAAAADDGWRDLIDGRSERAAAAFERRLAAQPNDRLARFGRATLAFERGDGPRALDDYTAVLEGAAADGEAAGDAAGPALLAPVAALRAGELLEEVPAAIAARAHVEDRLAALPPERLAWQARVELARIGDAIARRHGDPARLDRAARAAGCARQVFLAGSAGSLPHLDLDGAAPATPPAAWQPVLTPGCRVSVPPWDGRVGVQILKTAVEVPAGHYEIVIEAAAEARLRVDAAPVHHHGDEHRYGPRVSALSTDLTAGRHDIELRVGTSGTRTDVALWVLGATPAKFIDPRTPNSVLPSAAITVRRPGSAAPAHLASEGASAGGPGPPALTLYLRAVIAERLGDVERALDEAEALSKRRTFAVGLVEAARIARADPTRPVAFARDAARGLLRAAVAADPHLARALLALALAELDADLAREAIDEAREAAAAAPAWWRPELTLATALRARGLDFDADRALDRAAEKAGPIDGAPCAVAEALLHRADERRDLGLQMPLAERLERCEGASDARADRLRARGDLAGALAALRLAVAMEPDRDDLQGDLAGVLAARGDRAAALAVTAALAAAAPYDAGLRIRLADAQAAAGDAAAARRTLADALRLRPDVPDVRRAARAGGVDGPLDAFRIDGRQVIRDFEASGRRYAAPAVMVLDRTVHRVFPDGSQLVLTHNIVGVQSKDGIDRWGEVAVPAGAEILILRTHKKDGTTREPEAIAGKETISAADLAVGDFVEWETLESKGPSDAFARGGFIGDRFYFQSFDAPLDRTEYLLVTPPEMRLDADSRAGAPAPVVTAGAAGAPSVTTFAARHVAQLYAERSSVPAIEFVPSVRVSSQASWAAWGRFLAEQIYGTWRTSPSVRQLAARLAREAGASPAARAAAIVRFVTGDIEAGDDLRESASATLARGSGNRLALALALARELGVPARPELARSRLVADTGAAVTPQELDDFGDMLIRFDTGGAAPIYADLRLRHAPFGYLPPGLEGAKTMALDGTFGVARGPGADGDGADQRVVDMTIRLDEKGGGRAMATEELTGLPALEWAELLDRFGSDRAKLRQDFEQRWLGVQFPGARLDDLSVDLTSAPSSSPFPTHVRVRYSFVSPRLAVRSNQEIKLSPTFFRSQPGRRFATEARRSTTLMLGFDVPFRLTATLVLPSAAKLVDASPARAGVVARRGAYRFLEERTPRPGSPDVLLLRRESALPITRVTPSEYAGVAADLRRVDGLEQQEIRIRLPAVAAAGKAGAP